MRAAKISLKVSSAFCFTGTGGSLLSEARLYESEPRGMDNYLNYRSGPPPKKVKVDESRKEEKKTCKWNEK